MADWVDVSGPPGTGKSTICYHLWADKSVGWDGYLPPAHWKQFSDEMTSLCHIVKDHGTLEAVLRMNERSSKKMATVSRMQSDRPYVQNGFMQRILGFGWRLAAMNRDINLIRRACWLMPVSIGVVFLEASYDTLILRNKDRELIPETVHENRGFQVGPMMKAIPIAKEVMAERGVPFVEISTEQSIEDSRAQIVEFSNRSPWNECIPSPYGNRTMTTPPAFWRLSARERNEMGGVID